MSLPEKGDKELEKSIHYVIISFVIETWILYKLVILELTWGRVNTEIFFFFNGNLLYSVGF